MRCGVAALLARLMAWKRISLVVKKFRSSVGHVGDDVAALFAQEVVVVVAPSYVIQVVGEAVTEAPFRTEADVFADVDAQSDAEGDGKAGEGVLFRHPVQTLAFGAETLQLIYRAVFVLGHRVEGEKGETREDVWCEVVGADGVVEFEEIQLAHDGELSDGGVEAEIALIAVVGLHVAAGDLTEQEVCLDGPARGEIVTVDNAAREVRLCEKFGRVQFPKIESCAHARPDFGVLGAQSR